MMMIINFKYIKNFKFVLKPVCIFFFYIKKIMFKKRISLFGQFVIFSIIELFPFYI